MVFSWKKQSQQRSSASSGHAGVFRDAVGDPGSFVSGFIAYFFTQETNPGINQKEGGGTGSFLSRCLWNGNLGMEISVLKCPGDAQSCQRKGDLTQFPRLFCLH